MRVTVVIPRALLRFAAEQRRVELELDDGAEATVGLVLRTLAVDHPGVPERTLDERGELRRHVNVFVGTENVRDVAGLATPVHDGAEVSILPAVSGG